MRKLVLGVLFLLAIFSIIRAYPEAAAPKADAGKPSSLHGAPSLGVSLHPGVVEIGDGGSSIGLAFGAVERAPGKSGSWNVLPLRVVVRSADTTVALSLNGLSFLLQGGTSIGVPLAVDTPRRGDIVSIGGRVTVNSRVDGDIWTLGADIDLLSKADVAGNIVALGGKVTRDPKADVQGSVTALPELKIPFLGVLGSRYSVAVVELARELLGFILFGLALFLASYYLLPRSRELFQSLAVSLRASLITVLLCLVLVPLLAVLLVVSVVGIYLLPLLALVLFLFCLDGFLAVSARLGVVLRRGEIKGSAGDSFYLFTSGLLGIFLLKLPSIAGILLNLASADAAVKVGEILRMVGIGATALAMVYGLGAELAFIRKKASR